MKGQRKYICVICDEIYDEVLGDPKAGIPAGTLWEDVPSDWTCPDCGATKDAFTLMD